MCSPVWGCGRRGETGASWKGRLPAGAARQGPRRQPPTAWSAFWDHGVFPQQPGFPLTSTRTAAPGGSGHELEGGARPGGLERSGSESGGRADGQHLAAGRGEWERGERQSTASPQGSRGHAQPPEGTWGPGTCSARQDWGGDILTPSVLTWPPGRPHNPAAASCASSRRPLCTRVLRRRCQRLPQRGGAPPSSGSFPGCPRWPGPAPQPGSGALVGSSRMSGRDPAT